MAGPSSADLEEIASGKGSARDMAEAGVRSAHHARTILRSRHGKPKVKTTWKKRPVR